MAELLIEEVTKEYPTRSEPLVVLRGVSLRVTTGENLAILGPSGCGKSTLLHILGTLDQPTSGRVLLDGRDANRLAEPELAEFRNRQIGFVFQDHHLLPQCSVLENVLLPAVASGAVSEESIARARQLVDRVGLTARSDHRPAELSGGERQRTALARALLNRPLLLLADEPTGNLDRSTALGIARLLVELEQQEQTMLVVVTHSLEVAALFQRRYELDGGVLKRLEA